MRSLSPDDERTEIDGVEEVDEIEGKTDEIIGELLGEEDLDDLGVGMKCGKCGPEKIEAGSDERQVKKLADPRMPTEAEVEDHSRTIYPTGIGVTIV